MHKFFLGLIYIIYINSLLQENINLFDKNINIINLFKNKYERICEK